MQLKVHQGHRGKWVREGQPVSDVTRSHAMFPRLLETARFLSNVYELSNDQLGQLTTSVHHTDDDMIKPYLGIDANWHIPSSEHWFGDFQGTWIGPLDRPILAESLPQMTHPPLASFYQVEAVTVQLYILRQVLMQHWPLFNSGVGEHAWLASQITTTVTQSSITGLLVEPREKSACDLNSYIELCWNSKFPCSALKADWCFWIKVCVLQAVTIKLRTWPQLECVLKWLLHI